tara:strand:+ start:3539 stop:4309 length:771 start_codon:yes stop_codon:yes gene_type:complete
MPIFPGPVRHNNPGDVILDLTANQVKGIGVFDQVATSSSVESRNDLKLALRTEGYVATIKGDASYVYTNSDTTNTFWEDTNNWVGLGSSGLPAGGDEHSVLTRSGGTSIWSNTVSTSKLTILNHSVNPGDSEIVFSRKDTDGYTLANDVLGEIRAEGFANGGATRIGGPSIKFIGTTESQYNNNQEAKIEFHVSGIGASGGDSSSYYSGSKVGLTLKSDRSVVFSSLGGDEGTPTAEAGGFYYNSDEDDFYVGKNA